MLVYTRSAWTTSAPDCDPLVGKRTSCATKHHREDIQEASASPSPFLHVETLTRSRPARGRHFHGLCAICLQIPTCRRTSW